MAKKEINVQASPVTYAVLIALLGAGIAALWIYNQQAGGLDALSAQLFDSVL